MPARLPKPRGWRLPTYGEARYYHQVMRSYYREAHEDIAKRKRALNGDIGDALSVLPADKTANIGKLAQFGIPQYNDYIDRVTGMIIQEEPEPMIIAPGIDKRVQERAALEERALKSWLQGIEAQQNRSPYAQAVHAQVAAGGSWLHLQPDPALRAMKRGDDESPTRHVARAKKLLKERIPFILSDVDPHLVYPFFGDRERLMMVQVQSDHTLMDVELGMGYAPVGDRGNNGRFGHWRKVSLGEPQLSNESVDGDWSSPSYSGEQTVERLIHTDPWGQIMFLDGIPVERWEHGMGYLPFFPAFGGVSFDRTPRFLYKSIADNALSIARQLVLWNAIRSLVAFQYAFPIGVATGGDGSAVQLKYGEIAMPEDITGIEFPFNRASTPQDLAATFDWLVTQMQQVTLPDYGAAINAGTSGYAISQLRATTNSVLGPIYTSLNRQWRDVFLGVRAQTEQFFPGGYPLPGVVERMNDGRMVRRQLEYSKARTTDYDLQVEIERGIPQDKIAEHKALMEEVERGFLPRRTAMEFMGRVEDVGTAEQEIILDELRRNPIWRDRIVEMGMAEAEEIDAAMQEQFATPGAQAVQSAGATFLGGAQNQPALPMNQNAAGPINQQGQQPNPGGGTRQPRRTPVAAGVPQQTPSGPQFSEKNPP